MSDGCFVTHWGMIIFLFINWTFLIGTFFPKAAFFKRENSA